LETAIRIPGYQEVDIRISEYQAVKEAFVWSPDFLVPCNLISWSPDTRPDPAKRGIEQLADFKALK
jgi:hypothetical protein